MSEFKQFLEESKTEENSELLDKIIEGYNLFEAGESIPMDEYTEEPLVESKKESNLKQELIDGLNDDLSREYSAAIRYVQHAAVMVGVEYMDLRKEFLAHADEELDHAKQVSDRINFIGGVPTVKVAEIKTSGDVKEMIRQNKEAEETAVREYSERIKIADELGDEGTKHMLMHILNTEEEHLNDLQIAIGK